MSALNSEYTFPVRTRAHDAFALAAGMLRRDVGLFVPLLILASFGGVAETLLDPLSRTQSWGLEAVKWLSQLGVLAFVVARWRRILGRECKSSVRSFMLTLRMVVAGFLVWGALMMPVFLIELTSAVSFPIVVLLILGIYWWFRFYFYFVSYGLLGVSLRQGISTTLELSRRDIGGALRSLMAPIAITSLVTWIVAIPSPDGRSIEWAAVGAATEGLFWLLSIYTGLGVGLRTLGDSEWRDAGLGPYRRERLETLEAQGKASWFNLLSPKAGAKVFVIALLVMAFNIHRAVHAPPAVSVKVIGCEAVSQNLRIALELRDPNYHYRGFSPLAFSVASQTGFEQFSTEIVRIARTPEGKKGEVSFPLTKADFEAPITLYLEFATNKTDEVLKKLDNMWLWYHQVSLVPLRVGALPEK